MEQDIANRNFKEDWKIIVNKVAELHLFLDFYKGMFKPDNQKVINEFPYFFRTVQLLTIENLILGIARLCDPYKGSGGENLTLEALIEIHPAKIRSNYDKHYCKRKLECIKEATNSLRKIRNKRIAHFDYKKGPYIYEEVQVTLNNIENVLKEIDEFMNLFESGQGEINFGQAAHELLVESDYVLGFILADKKILDELYLLRGVLPKEDKEDMYNSIARILRRRSEKLPAYINNLKEFLLNESWEF